MPAMTYLLDRNTHVTTFYLFQAQFWMILLHTSYAAYLNCDYPSGYGLSLVLYMVSHILLFSNFYNKAYTATAKTVKALSPRRPKATREANGNHSKRD